MRYGWIYEREREIHKRWIQNILKGNIGREWYLLIYEDKINFIIDFAKKLPKSLILDVGSGEGAIVDILREIGHIAFGVDLNYAGGNVILGDGKSLPFKNETFEVVMLLDVLEHIDFPNQYIVLDEIRRVLKFGGILVLSVPNLASIGGRLKLLLLGEVSRGDKDINHIGERTFKETKKILKSKGFEIIKSRGICLNLPIFWQMITKYPQKMKFLYKFLNKFAFPSLSLVNIFISRKIYIKKNMIQ